MFGQEAIGRDAPLLQGRSGVGAHCVAAEFVEGEAGEALNDALGFDEAAVADQLCGGFDGRA